jgi:hypothetical protein
VKIVVCHSCGLTMHSGPTKCTRCKNKTLRSHDILCEDTYRLHKRIQQLGGEHESPHSSPMMSAMLVVALSGLAIMGWDYYSHPKGLIATQVNALVAAVPAPIKAKIHTM